MNGWVYLPTSSEVGSFCCLLWIEMHFPLPTFPLPSPPLAPPPPNGPGLYGVRLCFLFPSEWLGNLCWCASCPGMIWTGPPLVLTDASAPSWPLFLSLWFSCPSHHPEVEEISPNIVDRAKLDKLHWVLSWACDSRLTGLSILTSAAVCHALNCSVVLGEHIRFLKAALRLHLDKSLEHAHSYPQPFKP